MCVKLLSELGPKPCPGEDFESRNNKVTEELFHVLDTSDSHKNVLGFEISTL